MGFFSRIFTGIKNWFGARFSEASSWTALGSGVMALGILADIDEAPAIVNAIVANANALAGGEYASTIIQAFGGLLIAKGFIKPEKFND